MMRALLVAGCAVALIAACQRDEGRETPHGAPQGTAMTPVSDIAGGVLPGIHSQVSFGSIHNPYDGNVQAERDGRQLFLMYNCVGCHGGRAGGGMGPSLRDSAWIYGNSDVNLFATITEGRPNGMPTWGGKIPEDQIWKLISYIRTLRSKEEPDPPPPATQPNR
jgi:cytochrome c oxidase cbb3-type subunit 3